MYVTEVMPQLSLAPVNPMPVTSAVHAPGSAFTVLLGQLPITGASWSTTVTLKLHVEVCPHPSSAVNVTVVEPNVNAAPETGPAVCFTVTVPHGSTAVDVANVTTAEHCPGSVRTCVGTG